MDLINSKGPTTRGFGNDEIELFDINILEPSKGCITIDV